MLDPDNRSRSRDRRVRQWSATAPSSVPWKSIESREDWWSSVRVEGASSKAAPCVTPVDRLPKPEIRLGGTPCQAHHPVMHRHNEHVLDVEHRVLQAELEDARDKLRTCSQQRQLLHSELETAKRISDTEQNELKTELAEEHKSVKLLAQQDTVKTTELQLRSAQLEKTTRELHSERQQRHTCQSELHASNRVAFEEKRDLRNELAKEQHRYRQAADNACELHSAWKHAAKCGTELQAALRIAHDENREMHSEVNLSKTSLEALQKQNNDYREEAAINAALIRKLYAKNESLEASMEADRQDRSHMKNVVMELSAVVHDLQLRYLPPSACESSLAVTRAGSHQQEASSVQLRQLFVD